MSSRLQDPDASRSLQSASPSRINHLSNGDIKFTSLTVGGDGKSRGESLAMEDLLRPSITIKVSVLGDYIPRSNSSVIFLLQYRSC